MKDVLLLHDNARPHTVLCTLEAIANMGRNVVPHPLFRPDFAPSDNHPFGPVRHALRGRHFADANELELLVLSEVEAGNLRGMEYRVLLNVGKNVFKMSRNLWKNSLIISKDV
jgi:hypothetical protein